MPATPEVEVTIRPAVTDDAFEIAHVHVLAWRETYPGLLPDDMLSGLSVSRRAAWWQKEIPNAETMTFVAEWDGGVVGFCHTGRCRSRDLARSGYDGEVSALYVLRSAQRHGIGTALMRAGATYLSGLGCARLGILVLRENATARRFYERLGGEALCELRDERPDGTILIDVVYGWRDLGLLCR